MSAINFGYEARPKGRHVAAAEREPSLPAAAARTLDERAAESFARLRKHMASVPSESEDSIDIRSDVAVIVVCGDPQCAGDDGSGRWPAHEGRCPKCGGYAMPLHLVAKLRSVGGGEGGSGDEER